MFKKTFFLAASLGAVLGCSPTCAQTTLWQFGQKDDSSAEFADRSATDAIEAGQNSATVPKGLMRSRRPDLSVRFSLPRVPQHGAILRFKLLHAHKNGPQMGVFSNENFAGTVQLWGTGETGSPFFWRKTYELFVPANLLKTGENVLRLEAVRPLWANEKADETVWFEWDYLQLEAPTAPVSTPIHGKMAGLGTTIKLSSGSFAYDERTLAVAPLMCEWLGIAYSQNPIRADFWFDVSNQQPMRREFLELMRDLNMTVVADHISSYHVELNDDGSLSEQTKADVRAFFQKYGSLFQFYELANEPTGIQGNSKWSGNHAALLTLAKFINEVKPAHVVLAAPGWAYNDKVGTPPGWERDPQMRRLIEDLCGATNGHSYGYSYNDLRGGSFPENLATYEGVQDGWPKPYVNTEFGTNNWHSEQNAGTRLPSTQDNASAFDRITRAHIAVADHSMQHASIFDDFGIFSPPTNWSDVTTLSAFPGVDGQDTRLKTFRRLALAYATNGAPLPFSVQNAAQIAGKKVLFRGVDTSKLAPLPGSGAKSDKVLLNFVNFEETPQTLSVRVTMPSRGVWSGTRIGDGTTYAASHQKSRLVAAPALDLTVSLAPGEGVQYILARGENQNRIYKPLAAPDLVIESWETVPQNPKAGDEVRFRATIANRGTKATPEGTTLGVHFGVAGKGLWSASHSAALAPGAKIVVTSDGGGEGNGTWKAQAGKWPVKVHVDDVNRLFEADETNNEQTREISVAGL